MNLLVKYLFRSWAFRRLLGDTINSSFANSSFHIPQLPKPISGNPYKDATGVNTPVKFRPELPPAIFITSRFRSGSTLLWSIFHELGSFTSFYEPLNERRWFLPDAGESVDPTHIGVSDYRLNYENMEDLGQYFSEKWSYNQLFMSKSTLNWDMQKYIDELLTRASKPPVLQFNRVDFRLPWLRANYPGAKFIHLIRDPREQWMSILYGQAVPLDTTLADFKKFDRFYLLPWISDLRTVFPILDLPETASPYRAHYMLWRLSCIYGQQFADLTLKYEDLVGDPVTVLKACLSRLSIPDVTDEQWSSAVKLIQTSGRRRSPSYAPERWYAEHEEACDSALQHFFNR